MPCQRFVEREKGVFQLWFFIKIKNYVLNSKTEVKVKDQSGQIH